MEPSILEIHRQNCNKTNKNQDENINKSNELNDFVHYIADLIRSLYIFHFLF